MTGDHVQTGAAPHIHAAGDSARRDSEVAVRQPDTTAKARRRWRLLLGTDPDRTDSESDGDSGQSGLEDADRMMDRSLAAIYDRRDSDEPDERRSAGLGASAPRVTKWLADIRTLFPTPIVSMIQTDALERLDLTRLMQEPEFIEAVEPDIHLACLPAGAVG